MVFSETLIFFFFVYQHIILNKATYCYITVLRKFMCLGTHIFTYLLPLKKKMNAFAIANINQ